MSGEKTTLAVAALKITLAVLPWLASMYVFYWLDSSGVWTSDTPHRGKLSVALLATGMLGSFLVHTWLNRRAS